MNEMYCEEPPTPKLVALYNKCLSLEETIDKLESEVAELEDSILKEHPTRAIKNNIVPGMTGSDNRLDCSNTLVFESLDRIEQLRNRIVNFRQKNLRK